MSNHNYVCLRCHCFYDTKKVGVYVEELAPVGPSSPDGPRDWEPYKIYCGDLFECPRCGHQLVSGFGRGPIAEHYQPNYEAIRARLDIIARIDDC